MRSLFIRVAGCTALSLVVAEAAAAGCDAPSPKILLERFVPADCESCWASAKDQEQPSDVLVLDWITPAGDAAPMASAALPSALTRLGSTPAKETALRSATLVKSGASPLRVVDGPAWNGYVALQLSVERRAALPPGAVAYAALVERVPAGSEGSAIARQLVREVVGPLSLHELASKERVQHMHAVRLPPTDRPERLASVAWVETADGRVIAASQSAAGDCPGR
ncbi:hypothetical protein [Piscinibacter sp.]|uniref:hypothetical protein n=1 Tax=Piscinibacter sp. TaxID=1903157 RepID=UPI002B723C59|nr:hypothetical protein [Albitalea sp.]HUG23123.1 hypothetical protein [Albitalea sp.]